MIRILDRPIQALVFDCDGVLLDSNGIKIRAFHLAALNAGIPRDVADRFSSWQSANFGLSRYVVFDELLRGRFGEGAEAASRDDLLELYAESLARTYPSAEAAPGAAELIDALDKTGEVDLYVASASDEVELRAVLGQRPWASAFREILGSPRSKTDNLRSVSDRYPPGEVVMIGDSHADLDAANATECTFIFASALSTVRESLEKRCAVEGHQMVTYASDLLRFSEGLVTPTREET